jgi:pyruvate kinase
MRILVLEDSKPVKELIKKRLQREGHQVDVVDNGHQGFVMATSQPYDVVISDVMMPHWDGFKFVEAMEVVCPRIPIIIVTGCEVDSEMQGRIGQYINVLSILTKPLNFEQFFEILETVNIQNHDNVNKKARIVCTLGPASSSAEILGKMVLAGMDVARLNFSHGSYEQHEATLKAVRTAEEEWGKPVAILQDLCGPKIRTGIMTDNEVHLVTGARVVIQAESIPGTSSRISTAIPEIIKDLRKGDPVLLDDGLLELRVIKEGSFEVVCEVIVGGILKSNKGMNLPATTLSLPSVTDKDWRDLDWALEHSVDYVALSFVRTPEEIEQVKEYIRKSGKRDLRVVAKIEKPEAVKNIKDIIRVSDAVMIARGDMGVELPAARVPRIQQQIIRLCWEMNTPVITATQMLDSMTVNSRPTRAEVTDVSMAIREGTDAVMLSQETATGIDPVNVIRTMASIIREEEQYTGLSGEQYEQLLSDSAGNPALTAVAGLSDTAAVILLDKEGKLYPLLSKWNRKVPSLLVTGSKHMARHASLYYNIVPMISREELGHDAMIKKAMDIAMEWGYIRGGERVAVVEGRRQTRSGLDQVGALQIITVPLG